MFCIRAVLTLVAVILLNACATPGPNWPTGIPESDVNGITRLIRSVSDESIVSYDRRDDGSISLHMNGAAGHSYVVRRINGKWKIVDEYVIVS